MKLKAVKVAALAILAVIVMTGCDPITDPGKAGKATHKAILSKDGEYNIGVQRSRMTIAATGATSACTWTLMYDLPHGKVVVVAKGGASSAKDGISLKARNLKYKDPKTGKMVRKKDHPTSIYTEGCGVWIQQ